MTDPHLAAALAILAVLLLATMPPRGWMALARSWGQR